MYVNYVFYNVICRIRQFKNIKLKQFFLNSNILKICICFESLSFYRELIFGNFKFEDKWYTYLVVTGSRGSGIAYIIPIHIRT